VPAEKALALLPLARGKLVAKYLLKSAASQGLHVECALLVDQWRREGDSVDALSRELIQTEQKQILLQGPALENLIAIGDCGNRALSFVDAWASLPGIADTMVLHKIHTGSVMRMTSN